MDWSCRWRRRALLLALAAVLAGAAGCGGDKYPVEGQLLWEDGSQVKDLKGGLITFHSKGGNILARGEIQGDGTFRLSTARPHDGAPPGHYRVQLGQPLIEGTDRFPPPPMHERYLNLETSKLEFTVEKKKNEPVFRLERSKRAKR